jgi:hypothetical protein
MSRFRRHLSFANVASLMALIFSMSGGALAAHYLRHPVHHYTITSTSQISPKVLRKLKGESGEIGPTGAQGPTGPTGPKGPSGERGEAAPSSLPSGGSESGVFGLRGATSSGALADTLTFRIPLVAGLAGSQVVFTKAGTPVKNCQGPGFAGRGYLCLYSTVSSEVGEPKAFNIESSERGEGTGKLGFTLEVPSPAGKLSAYEGTYTVTAP